MKSDLCLCCGRPLSGITEKGWHRACLRRFFQAERMPDLSSLLQDIEEGAALALSRGAAVTGVQRKLSFSLAKGGRITAMASPGQGASFLAKTGEERWPLLPEWEHLLMTMAEHSRIPVVPHALVELEDGTRVYLSRRIDREGERRIAMEDFCQLSGKLSEQKYSGSYEYAWKAAGGYSSSPALDAIRYGEIVLFSYLTGNTDLHLKNFSLIKREEGYRLAPAYDLIPAEVIVPQEEMALSLSGKKRNITRKDLLLFLSRIGIREGRILLDRLLLLLPAWTADVERSFLPEDGKKRYISFLERRVTSLR